MRKILNKYIVSLVCFAAANLFAQTSNPGYLGKTRVVNFGVEGFLSFMDGMPMRFHQFSGLSYESSRNSWLSFRGSAKWGGFDFDADDLQPVGIGYYHPQSQQINNIVGGTLAVSMVELEASALLYQTQAGSLAPFGTYYSLGLYYAFLNQDDKTVWNSRAITADKVEDGHTVLSLGLNYGGRRILFDKISLNYTIGIAYPISSSISKLSGNQLLSSKDAIHRFTYDFLKSSRTIKGSIEVGYFF